MTVEKQAYVPPALRSHGTVRALTRERDVEVRISPVIETSGVPKDQAET